MKKYLYNKLWVAFVVNSFVILFWFIFFWDKDMFILVNATYLRWPAYFMVMLMGAALSNNISKQTDEQKRKSGLLYLGLLIVLLLVYYGYQLLWNRLPILKEIQVVLLPALMGVTYSIYKICSNEKVLQVYKNKYLNWAFYGISACCLEIYLSGSLCFGVGRNMINLFPLNIIVTFLIIFIVAYIVKIISNFLSQTFKTEKYDWRMMIKL